MRLAAELETDESRLPAVTGHMFEQQDIDPAASKFRRNDIDFDIDDIAVRVAQHGAGKRVADQHGDRQIGMNGP